MPVIRTSSGTVFNVLITGKNYIGYVSTVFELNVLISGMFL